MANLKYFRMMKISAAERNNWKEVKRLNKVIAFNKPLARVNTN